MKVGFIFTAAFKHFGQKFCGFLFTVIEHQTPTTVFIFEALKPIKRKQITILQQKIIIQNKREKIAKLFEQTN